MSLTPASRPPPLVVSEQENNIEQSFRDRRKGFNIAFRVRRGRGGRAITNVEVMEVMQQITTRLEAMEIRNQGNVDDGDVSEPEIESPEEEQHVVITLEMRFLKSVLGSSSKPRPEIPIY